MQLTFRPTVAELRERHIIQFCEYIEVLVSFAFAYKLGNRSINHFKSFSSPGDAIDDER